LRPFVVDVTVPQDTPEVIDLDALRGTLLRLDAKLVEDNDTVHPATGSIADQAHEAHQLIAAVLHQIERMGKSVAEQALLAFQGDVRNGLVNKLTLLQRNLEAEPVMLADLPPELRTRYIGKTGK